MLWILYRYVVKELARNLLLATGVLVLVMSVAVAVKPLSDGLLGPFALMRFIFFMAPAMLSLALPFTGAFATTLVFHRLTADGETTLCRASGIGYSRLLIPAAVLGAAVAACLFLLSCWVIPWFYERAEHTLQRDIVSMVIRKVKLGEPIRHGPLILHADAAAEGEPPAVIGPRGMKPRSLVALTGIAVGRINNAGRIQSDGAAEHADMLLYGDDNTSWVILKVRNVQYFDDAQRGVTEELTIGPYLVRNPFSQKIRFFSLTELRSLKSDPTRYRSVHQAKYKLAIAIAAEAAGQTIAQQVNGGAPLRLDGSAPGEQYTVQADVARRESGRIILTTRDGSEVEVDRLVNGKTADRRFTAQRAELTVQPTDADEPTVTMHLMDVTIHQASPKQRTSRREDIERGGLCLPGHSIDDLLAMSLDDLTSLARRNHSDNSAIHQAAAQADGVVEHLMRMVAAEMHERSALVVCTLVMMIGGAILGMMMARRLALVVYLWMFVLAAVSVITTKTGGNLIASRPDGYGPGLCILWSGNAVAAAVLARLFAVLRRT